MVKLNDPWETIVNPENENAPKARKMQLGGENYQHSYEKKSSSLMLNADEYVIISDKAGNKSTRRGPVSFKPEYYGMVWGPKMKSILIPVNCYIIVNDTNNSAVPFKHVRGPRKFYPESFEIVKVNPAKARQKFDNEHEKYHFECIHISTQQACHLQMKDGSVTLVQDPQFYMPLVGERVLATVKLQLLLLTDFCIIKCWTGDIIVMNGQVKEHRAFFMNPFDEFVYFDGDENDEGRYILSTLPQFLNHNFMIRTSDNVAIDMVLRISYQIVDIAAFTTRPIQFVSLMQNYVQDEFLDRFAKIDLRTFMATFTAQSQHAIDVINNYFLEYGIEILDVQILDFSCTEKKVDKMLEVAIHTSVTKSNELRSVQRDVEIQEKNNEIMRKTKDLEVTMARKEMDVKLQKAVLQNSIRIKEMEIQILEETKRTELLEVKRGNDLVECEFRGRAKGHNLREFMDGIDKNLTTDEKMQVWMRSMDLQQSELLYDMVNEIRIQPSNASMKILNFVKPGELGSGSGTHAQSDHTFSYQNSKGG